jgi:hypothetical protein
MSEISIIFFLIFQLVAAYVLVYGLYHLIKEIQLGGVPPKKPEEVSEEIPEQEMEKMREEARRKLEAEKKVESEKIEQI